MGKGERAFRRYIIPIAVGGSLLLFTVGDIGSGRNLEEMLSADILRLIGMVVILLPAMYGVRIGGRLNDCVDILGKRAHNWLERRIDPREK